MDCETQAESYVNEMGKAAVARLRRVFGLSIVLCALIGLYLLLTMQQRSGAVLRASLVTVLLWGLVVTSYAFYSLWLVTQEARQKLQKMHCEDGVTGLSAETELRTKFRERLQMSENPQTRAAVGYACLSGVEEINSDFGYTAGNVVLQQVSQQMKEGAPEDATVARLGGVEFAMLGEGDAAGQVEKVMKDFENRIRSYTLDLGARGRIEDLEVRVGTARFPKDGESLDELIKAARTEAKQVSFDEISRIGNSSTQIMNA
ncbi:MAG: diguanylate cyclase [Planctomycetes bacterium]|nr:diguanylate cyclase [Planctomycetota bacterium]